MEITYNGTDDLTIRFDDGRELDLSEILNLDKALTLTRTSREWNRKRVVELEDELERGGRKLERGPGNLFTSDEVAHYQSTEAELVAAPLRREIEALLAGREQNEHDKYELFRKLEAAREERDAFKEKVRLYDIDRYTERDRADNATARVKELEAQRDAARRREDEKGEALASARRRVAELEEALSRSIGRENKLENDAAEEAQLHRQSLAARDSLLEVASKRAAAARDILTHPKVVQANRMDAGPRVIADAVDNALRVLDA